MAMHQVVHECATCTSRKTTRPPRVPRKLPGVCSYCERLCVEILSLRGAASAGIYDSLVDLKLGELLDTPPPGLDEAVAISKVRKR